MTKIIGLSDSHDASAALIVDGKMVAAVQEERFTNVKNEFGFPYHCIQWLKANHDLSDLDLVVFATQRTNPQIAYVRREANYSIKDWIHEQHAYWKPRLLEGKDVNFVDIFKGRTDFTFDSHYNYEGYLEDYGDWEVHRRFQEERLGLAAAELGVARDRAVIVSHEDCHKYYALCASPLHDQDVCVVTAEGMGDYSNATVSVFRDGRMEEISASLENRLATLYRYITLILGMKPNEHEYKVMGLAPYAKMFDVEKVLPIFEDLMEVEGIEVRWRNKPRDLYFTMQERLEGYRFDHIAGALQLYLENMLRQWFANIARHTGLRRFVFAGGLAQNIKACMSVAELDEVDDLFVCPASGDTSLSVGAAYCAHVTGLESGGGGARSTRPLEHAYLGMEFTQEDCERAMAEADVAGRYHVIPRAGNTLVARLLAGGFVMARFKGRMEFGMRALGNRSILADPRDPATVKKINDKIKKRDFWMPFTPSMLDTHADRYIVNPKGLRSPFMTMAFNSTPLGRRDLAAAMHPADYTVRPQIVTAEANPDYHDLISQFAVLTGVGALLNTSFNLSGSPIVGTPARAIETFDNSGLDGLILGDSLVLRHKEC